MGAREILLIGMLFCFVAMSITVQSCMTNEMKQRRQAEQGKVEGK